MESSLQKQLVFLNEIEERFEWNWASEFESKLAVIGDNNNRRKHQILDTISNKLTANDPKTVFRIKANDVSTSEIKDAYDLIAFEEMPTENIEINELFDMNRMDFVQTFLEAISLLKGESRTGLIPLASYRRHAEGPLKGYIRAVERLEDGERKQWLENQFNSLRSIDWYYIEGSGYTYMYEKGSIEETLVSFMKGIWSYWALTSNLSEPQQMLMIIDVPKELTSINTPKHIKEITQRLVASIVNLTDEITLSTIISTETFFPVPEMNMRHHMYLKYDSLDFDWKDEENQTYFPEGLISLWKEETNEGVYIVDRVTGNDMICRNLEIDSLEKTEEKVIDG